MWWTLLLLQTLFFIFRDVHMYAVAALIFSFLLSCVTKDPIVFIVFPVLAIQSLYLCNTTVESFKEEETNGDEKGNVQISKKDQESLEYDTTKKPQVEDSGNPELNIALI